MKWDSWVKSQLRSYMYKEQRREDLLQQLKDVENDIKVSTMRLSHMPRSNALPSSTVERQAERREEIREGILMELEELGKESQRMERALQALGPVERDIIKWSYFSVKFEDERALASDMGLKVSQVERMKKDAFKTLFRYLIAEDEPLKQERKELQQYS